MIGAEQDMLRLPLQQLQSCVPEVQWVGSSHQTLRVTFQQQQRAPRGPDAGQQQLRRLDFLKAPVDVMAVAVNGGMEIGYVALRRGVAGAELELVGMGWATQL